MRKLKASPPAPTAEAVVDVPLRFTVKEGVFSV